MPVAADKTFWTEERIDRLKTLWAENDPSGRPRHSCTSIAAAIGGVTRNAVIGKVNRLGLEKRTEPLAFRVVKPKTERLPRQRIRRQYKFRPVMDLFEIVAPIPEFIGIQFVETNKFTCMYPEGDGTHMLFCGQPKQDGSSYCSGHHRLCYWKPDRPVYVGRAA